MTQVAVAPAPVRRGRPRGAGLDEVILEATVDELIDAGYRGLSIEAVAARAGVAKTTVYRRWPTKDELVFEALHRMKGPVQAVPPGTVRDGLLTLLEQIRVLWSSSRNGAVMRRLSAEAGEQPEHYLACRDRLVRPRHEVLRAVLGRGVAEGSIRSDVDLDEVIRMLVASPVAASFTHQHLTHAQLVCTVDTVLRGIAP